jgi:hypothetical protein
MANVLEEVTELELTSDHVERRVDDWARRIDALYTLIESWLPPGWTAERSRTRRMHEPLMQRFNLPARELPILDLVHDGHRVASIEPRGLWIIGTNGRLNLTREDQLYFITDEAEIFAQPSWRISPISDRRQLKRLDRDELLSLLS